MDVKVIARRLMDNVVKKEDGCWEWHGSLHKSRTFVYGKMTVNGITDMAHRWSYRIFVGEIPEKLLVCHKCDYPLCVNPEHLFVGTNRQNIDDAIAKGRMKSKLTWEKVGEIRELSKKRIKGVDLAKKFGVSPKLISYIINNERWRIE